MLKTLDSKIKFMMYEDGERKMTLKEQVKIIENKKKLGNSMFLVEVDGRYIDEYYMGKRYSR